MRIALPLRVDAEAVRRCDPRRQVIVLAGAALGTTWRVSYHGTVDAAHDRLRTLIEQRLQAIVAEMSQWDSTSVLSRFNRAPAGTLFSLPPDFASVLGTALDIARLTGGAFDPTHGRAAALLSFGALPVREEPSVTEFRDAHAAAGWQRIRFDPATRMLRQPGGLWLDFSGIGKGFAVDMLAELLEAQGIADALVEIGGELVGRGLRPDGQPWWVDLETPPGPATLPPLRIGLHGIAVATSGDYVRGAHTLDPRTGLPLNPQVAAVSVIHDSAMLADAWATALTVLGPEAGLAVAERHRIAARIVTREDASLVEVLSPALCAMLES